MKIAIHQKDSGFTPGWIRYCKERGIDYKLVNAYDNDIVNQVKDCDIFLWHHHHGDQRDVLFAKQLLSSLEAAGIKVYPDHNTGWHFDDKVGQKYLLETLELPLVPSYVFYEKKEAFKWIDETSFPKVFKLRGGAGSSNVHLIKTKRSAKKYVNKAFGRGFKNFNRIRYFKERIRLWKEGKDGFLGVLKGFGRLFFPPKNKLNNERGYVYFQDFMPGNDYDTRIVIIGNKYALAEKRYVRNGDFRASGSGDFSYDNIDLEFVRLGFEAAKKIKSQSLALDFIYDENHSPRIVEMSYGFGIHGIKNTSGYWGKNLKWNPSIELDIETWIIDELIKPEITHE